LNYLYQGKTINEVLNLTVEESLSFFKEASLLKRLEAMLQVGLGYLSIGQPMSTLSGGECQRMKLASEFYKHGSIYLLDEPSTGLHLSDIKQIMMIMNHLVDQGNTVIVIEHHIDIIRQADWIVDVGPDGGDQGGRIVYEGVPAGILKTASLTGRYL